LKNRKNRQALGAPPLDLLASDGWEFFPPTAQPPPARDLAPSTTPLKTIYNSLQALQPPLKPKIRASYLLVFFINFMNSFCIKFIN